MPDDATSFVPFSPLRSCPTFLKSEGRFLNSAELLITGHNLTGLAINLLKNSKVADQVKQMRRTQHSSRQHLLTLQCRTLSTP